jgi:hypothetical protein
MIMNFTFIGLLHVADKNIEIGASNSVITISAMADRSVWPGLLPLMLRCGIEGPVFAATPDQLQQFR